MYLYGYGSPPKRLTVAELEQRPDWANLHPEFKKRLLAMFDASSGALGCGGGWRSSAQQEAVFRQRYVKVSTPTALFWEGSYWSLKPGNAPAAPPNLSYHESTIDGKGVAADLIGDLGFLHAHGAEFGLRDFTNVGNEPWHCQPVELPTSRRVFNTAPASFPLKFWAPPAPPTPVPAPPVEAGPPEGDHRMLVVVGLEENHSDPRRWAWSGTALRLLKSEAEFNQLRLIFPFHPNWCTLASPYWMTQADIDSYTA